MTTTSTSENNGVLSLNSEDRKIYSIGISTAGSAEIKMAFADVNRHITATTLDLEGALYARRCIAKEGLSQQIEVKIEDVSQPLPYPNGHFDFIYARLVLHYLGKQALHRSLTELHRILRTHGRIFIVVRSVDCPDLSEKDTNFDPVTCLTTCAFKGKTYARYFHSENSIKECLSRAEFTVQHSTSYQEQLYVDFLRRELSPSLDSLIEVLAKKS